MQVALKKSRMTVMKNQHDELVPIKLNQATRKDHFPFPFIDQVLEKLARKSHYCFLDGFSGYMQIHIAPKDQHKRPSLAHSVPLRTHACCLACAMHRTCFNVA
ncbi:hypothetical protein CR513_25435, partial [Mucuna pruriens]